MEVQRLEFEREISSFPVSNPTITSRNPPSAQEQQHSPLSKRVLESLLSARLEKQKPPLLPAEFPPLPISGSCEDAYTHVHSEYGTFPGQALGLVLACRDERVTILPA